jgi:hypothetical protein
MDPTMAGPHCRNRMIEWTCAAILLGYAIVVIIWPTTIAGGNFRYLLQVGIGPFQFIIPCLILGLARMAALYFNGQGLPWSARVRAVGAIGGGIIFATMALMLGAVTRDGLPLPLGCVTHAALAVIEMYSCLRAGADVAEKEISDAIAKRRSNVPVVVVSVERSTADHGVNAVDALTRTQPNNPSRS